MYVCMHKESMNYSTLLYSTPTPTPTPTPTLSTSGPQSTKHKAQSTKPGGGADEQSLGIYCIYRAILYTYYIDLPCITSFTYYYMYIRSLISTHIYIHILGM